MAILFIVLGIIFVFQLIRGGSIGVLGLIFIPKSCFIRAKEIPNPFIKTFWVFIGFIWLLFGLGILFVIGYKIFTGRWI